jgi:hypothetical protein
MYTLYYAPVVLSLYTSRGNNKKCSLINRSLLCEDKMTPSLFVRVLKICSVLSITAIIVITALFSVLPLQSAAADPVGSISGSVYALAGSAALQNIAVELDGPGAQDQYQCTDINGHYSFQGLVVGQQYYVSAAITFASGQCGGHSTGYVTQFWQNAATQSAATPLVPSAASPDLTGKDFSLEAGATISGIVQAVDGSTPLANIPIELSGPGFVDGICTGSDGHYSFAGSVPFDIAVQVQAAPAWAGYCGTPSNFISEYWQETRNPGAATPLTLTHGSAVASDINFTLEAGGSVSGTASSAKDAAPLEHIAISLLGNNFNVSICTGADGHYTIHGVPFGLELRARADAFHDPWCNAGAEYLSEYWQDTRDSNAATLLTLTSGNAEVDGINFTLDASGSVSGTAYAAKDSTPLEHIAISLHGDNFDVSTCTAADGHYTISGVPLGLELRVKANTYHDAWCNASADYQTKYWWAPGKDANDGPGLLTLTDVSPNQAGIDLSLDLVADAGPAPNLDGWYVDDVVQAFDWPAGTPLKLTIEDPTTPDSPDYTAVADVPDSLSTSFDLGGFDLKPGMTVTVSGGFKSAIIMVRDVTITSINPDLDLISGTTEPNDWMWMFMTPGSCCRSTVADGSGAWSIDYSVTGPPPDNNAPVDIGPGSQGAIHDPSGEGRTSVSWSLPAVDLIVSKTGSGSGTVTSSPPGIDCGPTCSHAYNYSPLVTLTASAAAGSAFTGWSGAGCFGTGQCALTMSAAKSVTANFGLLPGAFSKSAPVNAASSQSGSLTLKWATSPGATAYYYCYDKTNDNQCATWVNNGAATSKTITGLGAPKTYYWHVKAVNAAGTTYSNGSGAAFWSFKTGLPAAFNKISPPTGAVNQPLNPTLKWLASPGAAAYYYCYDTSNDNQCVNWVSTGAVTSKALAGLAPNTTYYWHVKAVNSFGPTYSNGSGTAFWSFKTGALPAAFSKTSPLTSAINQPLNPTLKWAVSPGAAAYYYCYDTSNDNQCANWVNNGAATSKALSGLAPNTTYYWHVRAVNLFGSTYSNGSSTAFWSFKTGALPAPFSKTAPVNKAPNQPGILTLTWAASPGASAYYYCYDTTNDNQCTVWLSAGAATSKLITGLVVNTTYYWQVRAVNSFGITYANNNLWWWFKR